MSDADVPVNQRDYVLSLTQKQMPRRLSTKELKENQGSRLANKRITVTWRQWPHGKTWTDDAIFQTLDRNIFINHRYLEKLYHGTCVMFMFFSSTMNNIILPTLYTVLSMVSYQCHSPQSWRSVHAVCWAPPAVPSCGSVPSNRASWALPSFCPHGGN